MIRKSALPVFLIAPGSRTIRKLKSLVQPLRASPTGDEVKSIRTNAGGLPEPFNMAGQQEVEGLDLGTIPLAAVQILKGSLNCRAADSDAAHSRDHFDRQLLRRQPHRLSNDVQPDLSNPIPILALRISRVHEMAEPVL